MEEAGSPWRPLKAKAARKRRRRRKPLSCCSSIFFTMMRIAAKFDRMLKSLPLSDGSNHEQRKKKNFSTTLLEGVTCFMRRTTKIKCEASSHRSEMTCLKLTFQSFCPTAVLDFQHQTGLAVLLPYFLLYSFIDL